MTDRLTEFRRADTPLPEQNRLWPLYGPGFQNLGREGQAIAVPMPVCGPDELLVRHDACGLCFSDVKVIKLGRDHPRVHHDMQGMPVVLGHEVSITVVEVGENLRGQYRPGERFTLQPDIRVNGVGLAYGYEIQGGLSQYSLIDRRILDGDDGNYLLPVRANTGYAEAALTEPWACVSAAYRLAYRTGLKPAGTTWIIGAEGGCPALPSPLPEEEGRNLQYTISTGFDAASHPDRLLLTNVPAPFDGWLMERASGLGIEVIEQPDLSTPPATAVDDIIHLGADPDTIEATSPYLADGGVVALIDNRPVPRTVRVDVGRIHYNGWTCVGGRSRDIARAYSEFPIRSGLKAGGRTWFVGAGGPIGRMHVQRALQLANGPATILCTEVNDLRLRDLEATYGAEALAAGIDWTCVNPAEGAYASVMARSRERGFDDVVVLAPVPATISESASYLAPGGVMNIFAGFSPGTLVGLDLSDSYLRGVRIIGHSASTIDDLQRVLRQTETGQLSPNRSVAAIGSLEAACDGLRAVHDASVPGKVIIYPHIREMPLVGLRELRDRLPSVFCRLKDEREWTVEAEEELLRLMLV